MKKSNFIFLWCFMIFVSVSPQEAVIVEPDDIPETSSQISRQSLLSLDKFHHLNVPKIEEIMVYDDFECTFKCLHHPLCVSVNLAAEGQLWCELLSTDKYSSPNEYKENKNSHYRGYNYEFSNVTHEGQKLDLREDEKEFYHASESACADNPCEKNGTCQSGFTDKGHRCLCPTGFKGPNCKKDIDECATETHSCNANAVCSNTKGSYKCSCKPGYFGDGKICTMLSTCKEIYERNKLNKSGKVVLLLDSKPIFVFCHMGDFGCGDGGWTPVMKIDGSKSTFHYNSHFWSDRKAYNPSGGNSGFDLQETKLPTYWNTSFSKICLGLKIDQQAKFTVINKYANSVHSLIADGKYHSTSLGRNTWKALIGSEASLQPHCNKEGFNSVGDDSPHSKARIGIIADNHKGCALCDSRIGFGTGGHHDDSNTCGNEATHSSDNRDKHIKAMGYILVQ